MDLSSNPSSRHQPIHRYGAVVALLLVTGGLCLMFGQSQNIGWLEQRGWRLNYDTAGIALLWLGGLLMLPQLAYSLWVNFGPGRRGGWLKLAGFVIAALVAIAVLWIAPDSLGIDKYHGPDANAFDASADSEVNHSATFTLYSLRSLPGTWMQRNFDPNQQHYSQDRTTRTVWRGEHSLLSGVQDTYAWHPLAANYASSTQGEATVGGSDGYECLVQTERYVGPLVISKRTYVSSSANAASQPECKPVTRTK